MIVCWQLQLAFVLYCEIGSNTEHWLDDASEYCTAVIYNP